MNKKILALALSLSFFLISQCSWGQNNAAWTDYRGPNQDGHSMARNIPIKWSDSSNILWKTPIEGKGWSSPLILNDQIWITSAKNDGLGLYALCYDLATGKEQFNIQVFQKDSVQKQHPLNSFASPSVAIENARVYVHFGAYGTACLNSENGEILWKREDIYCDHEVGPGSSPILYKDLLIFHMDGTDVQYVIALNKKSGKTAWKTYRGQDFSSLRFDEKKAFCTPNIQKIDGKVQLISQGPHAIMGYNPQTGKQLWVIRYKGFSASARPLFDNNTMFINTGHGPSAIRAIRLGGKGDVTESSFIWENRRSMQARSSPLLIDGLIYMVNVGGQAKCINPDNGEVIWTQKVGGPTSASPFYAEGKIFTFDENGTSTIFKPGKSFNKVAENTLSSGCMASPAPIDGGIIVRTKSHLIRIR